MADLGGEGVNRILLTYEQELPAMDDRSTAVSASERAGTWSARTTWLVSFWRLCSIISTLARSKQERARAAAV